MRLDTEKTVEYVITLSQEEAEWLRDFIQTSIPAFTINPWLTPTETQRELAKLLANALQ